jgi:hypothetical protein
MINSIAGTDQSIMYSRYVELGNWISVNHARALARYEQSRGEINHLILILMEAQAVEDQCAYIDALPLLISEKQHRAIRAKRIKKMLADAESEELNVFTLLKIAIEYFSHLLITSPAKANPLKPIEKKYRNMPIETTEENNRSKWSLIETGGIFDLYPAFKGEESDDCADQASRFKEEFFELFRATASEADSALSCGIESLPASDWPKPICSLKDVYDNNLFGIKDSIESDSSVFADDRRVVRNGMAVVKSAAVGMNIWMDKQGWIKKPELALRLAIGLERLTKLNPNCAMETERLAASRKTIEDGYSFLIGYDKAVELIANRIEMPDFALFKMNAEPVLERIELINSMSGELRAKIESMDYADADAKERKIKALEEHFQPIRGRGLAVPEEAVAKAEALLRDDMKAFAKPSRNLLDILAGGASKRRKSAK